MIAVIPVMNGAEKAAGIEGNIWFVGNGIIVPSEIPTVNSKLWPACGPCRCSEVSSDSLFVL